MQHFQTTVGVGVVLAGALFGGAWPTFAQQVQQQRSGGLFGATRSDGGDRHRLSFLVAVSEAFDNELPPELQSQLSQRSPQLGGFSTAANVTAEYARMSRRGQFRGTAESGIRYYGGLGNADTFGHSVGVGGSLSLPSRGTLDVNQTAAYSPSYLYNLFPSVESAELGEMISLGQDYRVDLSESITYGTNVALGFSPRDGTRLGASAGHTATDFEHGSNYRDVTSRAARASLSQGVSRNLRVGVEYEYQAGEYQFGSPTVGHSLPVGIEYSPALSASRRALFSFRVTPSTLWIPESAEVAFSGRVTRVHGAASASFPFLRTWAASASYRRRVEYVAVLGEPIFADSARAEVGGMLARRVDVSAAAGYAAGQSASRLSNELDSYTGNVRVRVAWTRAVAAFGEYLYFRYDLRGRQFTELDLPAEFAQHGVRVGMMLWLSPF